MLSFSTVISSVLQILLMGLCGYVLRRREIVSTDGLKLLSYLLINLFLPCFLFHELTAAFSFSGFPRWWLFPFFCFGLVLTCGLLSGLFIKLLKLESKHEIMSLVMFQNSGYIPLILVKSLFTGELAHTLFIYIFLLLVGFNFLIWSLGVWLLTHEKSNKLQWKHFLNPPLVALLAGLVFIVLKWQAYIPDVIYQPITMFGQCALPLAMMVIGGNLASVSLGRVNWKELVTVLSLKMLVLPLLGLGAVMLWKFSYAVGLLVILETTVPCAVTLSVICRYYDLEGRLVNQGIFYSHLISVITIPLFLYAYQMLRG